MKKYIVDEHKLTKKKKKEYLTIYSVEIQNSLS